MLHPGGRKGFGGSEKQDCSAGRGILWERFFSGFSVLFVAWITPDFLLSHIGFLAIIAKISLDMGKNKCYNRERMGKGVHSAEGTLMAESASFFI